MLINPDFAVPISTGNKPPSINRNNLIVDIDVTNAVDLMTSKHNYLMKIFIFFTCGFVKCDNPALANFTINKVLSGGWFAGINHNPRRRRR